MKNLLPAPAHRPGLATLGLLGTLGLAASAQAQHLSHDQPGLRLGFESGLHMSTFAGPGCAGAAAGWRPGLALGVLATHPLGASRGLQVEALLSQKGITQAGYHYVYRDPAFHPAASTYRAALTYLDVPVLLVLGPGSAGRPGAYLAAGPQLSLALGRREFVRPTGAAAGDLHEETLSANRAALVPVGAGYVLGLGYRLVGGLGAELRYSGDFTHVYRAGYGAGRAYPGGSTCFGNALVQLQVSYVLGGHRLGRPARLATPSAPTWPHPSWHNPVAAPRRAGPPPSVLDSLRQDPRGRLLLRAVSVLSWLSFLLENRPAAYPYPSGGPLPQRGPARSRPLPRPALNRPIPY